MFLIINNIRKDTLRDLVYKKSDVKTILQDGLMKVVEGITTFEEILRMIDIESDFIDEDNLALKTALVGTVNSSSSTKPPEKSLDNIEILEGNLLDVVEGKADIVVANIIAEIICILTADVKKALNEGGLFITSGIIHDRVEMVTDKLKECGFEVMEINKDGEWNCIVAKSIG